MSLGKLKDDYQLKDTETETKDDLLLAYADSRHGKDPAVGFRIKEKSAVWVIEEPADWPYIVKEFNSLRHIFEPFSLAVAKRRQAVREAKDR